MTLASEWPLVTVEDLSERVAMGPFGSSIKVSTFVPDGVPIITGQHLHGVRLDEDPGFKFITPEHAARLVNANVQRGDVVFTHRGNIGQVSYIPEDSRFDRYVVSQSQFYVRCDRTQAVPEFIALYFTSPEGQHRILANTSQVGVPSIAQPVTYLRTLQVSLPPLPEQRAIAHILGTLDDKIELNRRMNATLEAMARALFRSWFVDFDPVRAKMANRDTGLPREIADLFPDRLVDSELGEIPESWDVSEIGSEVKAVGGGTPSTKEPAYWNGGQHCWATPKDLSKLPSPALLGTARKITDAGLKKISSGLLPRGTVLLSSRAPIGYLAIAEVPTAVNQGFIAMICQKRLPALYVLSWCHENLERIKDVSGGSTFAEISKQTFRPLPVVVPPKSVLGVYDEASRSLHDCVISNTRESGLLAALRDALLPKLVSGEMRVPDAEKPAGASHDRDRPRRSGPRAGKTHEGIKSAVDDVKSAPLVQLVGDIEAGILRAPPTQMSTGEIVWSRRTAMRDGVYRDYSEAQRNTLLDEIMKWGMAHRYHAVLATESGKPAGSGVCVTSGGRRGILTARHVLSSDAEGEEWRTNLCVGFPPPRNEMVQDQRRRQHGRQNSKEPLGPFQVTGISLGDRVTIVPLQRKDKIYPDPGLPDIAIIVVSDDIEERLRTAARDEGTAVPEPQWVDLDREDLVSIPYGSTNDEDKMLARSWLITGLRGERSDSKKFYTEMDGIVVDRIYRRSEYEYYGIFVDEVGGRRTQSRRWNGTSGGGVWQQGLKPSGWRKIEHFSSLSLTPDDLEPPVLGGIAFFHETRKPPRELSDGTRCYRGELYAHRIGGTLLDLIRRALRHGGTMVETGDGKLASGAAREQGESSRA